jgi:hypothetical protein
MFNIIDKRLPETMQQIDVEHSLGANSGEASGGASWARSPYC